MAGIVVHRPFIRQRPIYPDKVLPSAIESPEYIGARNTVAALAHASGGSAEKHAKYMRDKVVPAMAKLRELGDEIELNTPHEIWPLPTYREMLFVK